MFTIEVIIQSKAKENIIWDRNTTSKVTSINMILIIILTISAQTSFYHEQ